MNLMEEWRASVYDENMSPAQLDRIWKDYFEKEKNIYAQLLEDPDEVVTGTVGELAKKYGVTPHEMACFLDGIDDSLKKPNKLDKHMVRAKADWLYNLPQWDAIFPKDKQKELFKEQKLSGTVVKGKKIGRNDPCPCGSGKKYKHCCGR